MGSNKVYASLQFVKGAGVLAGRAESSGASWVPNTDVYLTDGGIVIKIELSGMRREDLELTIEGNQIRISGQRPDGCRAGRCKFLVMEINYGPFESVIELPPGYDLGRAKAAYQNGFLRIDVPERAPGTHQTVPVRSDES
jgi:HSP20 family protein